MPKKPLTPVPEHQTAFGSWLKQMREGRGLNQSDLAERCNATQEYISGLERGTRNPSRKMVWSLVQALRPDNANAERQDALLDEALSKAFGIRRTTGHHFSTETIRYAEVFERADEDAKELLGQAQGLLLKALASPVRYHREKQEVS